MNDVDDIIKLQHALFDKLAAPTTEETEEVETDKNIGIKGKFIKIKESKLGTFIIEKYLKIIGVTKAQPAKWKRYFDNIMNLIGDLTIGKFFQIADKGWNKLKDLFSKALSKSKNLASTIKEFPGSVISKLKRGVKSGIDNTMEYANMSKEEREEYRKEKFSNMKSNLKHDIKNGIFGFRGKTEKEAREQFENSDEYKQSLENGEELHFDDWVKDKGIKVKKSPKSMFGKAISVTRTIDKKIAGFLIKSIPKVTWKGIKLATKAFIGYAALWTAGVFQVSKQIAETMLHIGATPAEAMTASLLGRIGAGIEHLAAKDETVVVVNEKTDKEKDNVKEEKNKDTSKEDNNTNKDVNNNNNKDSVINKVGRLRTRATSMTLSGLKGIVSKFFGKKAKSVDITDPKILNDIENKATRLYYEYLQAGRTPEEANRAADNLKDYLLKIAIAKIDKTVKEEPKERKNSWLSRLSLWGKKRDKDGKDSKGKKDSSNKLVKGLGLTGGLLGIGVLLNKMGFSLEDIATGVTKVIDVAKTIGSGIGTVIDFTGAVIDKLGVIGTLLAAGAGIGVTKGFLSNLFSTPAIPKAGKGSLLGKLLGGAGKVLKTVASTKLGKGALLAGGLYAVGKMFGGNKEEEQKPQPKENQVPQENNNENNVEKQGPITATDVAVGTVTAGMTLAPVVSLAKNKLTKVPVKGASGEAAKLVAEMSKTTSDASKAKIFLKKGMGFIDKLKGTIGKKLGKAAAGKILGKIAFKFVPIIGWASLLWSIGEFFKLMFIDKKPFLNSLSISFTGIDFFGPDEGLVDPDTGEKLETNKEENNTKDVEKLQQNAINKINSNSKEDNKGIKKVYKINGKEVSEEEYRKDTERFRQPNNTRVYGNNNVGLNITNTDTPVTRKPPTNTDKGTTSPYIKPLKDSSPGGVADVDNLRGDVKQRLDALGKEYYDRYGKKLEITSGYRDPEHQAKIWEQTYGFRPTGNAAADKANPLYANSSKRGKVGHPSTSRHQHGVAFDINMTAWDQVKDGPKINANKQDPEVDGLLNKYGFYRPYTAFNGYKGFKERWHVGLTNNPAPLQSNEPDETVKHPNDEKSEIQKNIKEETDKVKKETDSTKEAVATNTNKTDNTKTNVASVSSPVTKPETTSVVKANNSSSKQATFSNASYTVNNTQPVSAPVTKPETPNIDFTSVNNLLSEGNNDRKLILATLQALASTITGNMNNDNKTETKQKPRPEMRSIDDKGLVDIGRKSYKV